MRGQIGHEGTLSITVGWRAHRQVLGPSLVMANTDSLPNDSESKQSKQLKWRERTQILRQYIAVGQE